MIGIIKILEKTNYPYDTLLGNAASEKSFRCIPSHPPEILHLATHGFYYPPNRSYRAQEMIFRDSKPATGSMNPLLRSGIVLAGANQAEKIKEDNDGILSAFEIAQMDLSKIDLAVLSACETGLGDILGNEGIYGLQRAFKLAGVNSIIMSLWNVPDKETSELMKAFYSYYMDGNTKQESLRKAQLDIRNAYSRQSDPFSWAAFVITE